MIHIDYDNFPFNKDFEYLLPLYHDAVGDIAGFSGDNAICYNVDDTDDDFGYFSTISSNDFYDTRTDEERDDESMEGVTVVYDDC